MIYTPFIDNDIITKSGSRLGYFKEFTTNYTENKKYNTSVLSEKEKDKIVKLLEDLMQAKRSFYTAFKNETGETPVQYQKNTRKHEQL